MIWQFELRDHQPDWAARYVVKICELKRLLPMALAFEHIGSTSIRTIAAVPTIDILAGVWSLSEITDAITQSLVAAGWEHMPDIDQMIPNRRFFHRPRGAEHRTTRTHHLHIVQYQTDEWLNPVLLRNYLREHPQVARQYERLKRNLASRGYENPSDYSGQKADFVAVVLRLAANRDR
jgi:GrpB-like predicted nucleotidyltransferase (UPF0157 family)